MKRVFITFIALLTIFCVGYMAFVYDAQYRNLFLAYFIWGFCTFLFISLEVSQSSNPSYLKGDSGIEDILRYLLFSVASNVYWVIFFVAGTKSMYSLTVSAVGLLLSLGIIELGLARKTKNEGEMVDDEKN